MVHPGDLERIARELTERSQRLRQSIISTKRALSEAVQDLNESIDEMKSCQERKQWLENMLANLRDSVAAAKTTEEREDFEDEIEEWEDEQREENEHMEFLVREHSQMLSHRKMLLTTLVALGRQFILVRQRERLLVAAAMRLGVVRLNRIKQVA